MDYISWYCNKSCIIEPGTQRLINTNNNDDDTNDSDSTELSVKIHSKKETSLRQSLYLSLIMKEWKIINL